MQFLSILEKGTDSNYPASGYVVHWDRIVSKCALKTGQKSTDSNKEFCANLLSYVLQKTYSVL
jgi:hypothetical protein